MAVAEAEAEAVEDADEVGAAIGGGAIVAVGAHHLLVVSGDLKNIRITNYYQVVPRW